MVSFDKAVGLFDLHSRSGHVLRVSITGATASGSRATVCLLGLGESPQKSILLNYQGGAGVVLHGGHHQPFTLGPDDSGTPGAPITYTLEVAKWLSLGGRNVVVRPPNF
jgi:hypothetical protein